MAISFPSSPSTDDVYLYNGVKYIYDGTKWISGGQSFNDANYVQTSGGTITGALTVNDEITATSGILFGTDTAAANTLDDYEEGTWTPTLAGISTAGSYTFTSDTWYTKVGNTVTIYARLDEITIVSAGSGTLIIGGLPFVNGSSNCLGSASTSSFDVHDSTVSLASHIEASGSVIKIRESKDNIGSSNIAITDTSGGTTAVINVQLTYNVG